MSMSVGRLENVVSHYLGLLGESKEAAKVLKSWGIGIGEEIGEAKWAQGRLLEYLADGVDKIGGEA